MDSLRPGFVRFVRSTSPGDLVPRDSTSPDRAGIRPACALLSALLAASSPAFAAIEGYGKGATGGAGGSVCTVTSSAEQGAGTFDSCVRKGGNQTIQFAVSSATVYTTSYLRSNTTLDGCTNGRSGVTLNQPANKKRSVVIEGPASNVVVRCIRFQGSGPRHSGYSVVADLLSLDGTGGQVSKVVVDRCTFVGSTDGALDITGGVSDVTASWSLFYGTPLTQLVKYGTRQRISLHHNVYTAGGERNPQIKGNARDIDFVSNAVYNETITSDGVGGSFSPYGTRLWNAGSGSDSPGNVKANLRSSFYGGANARLAIQTESGASAAAIYIASDNVCAGGCPSSPASTANAVTAGYAVTATPVRCMASQMLPAVGSPNRTATDQSKLAAVIAALPGGCAYNLAVAKAGTGTGTVTSSPTGVSCGTDCSQSYASGTVVTLTRTAAAGSAFTGWSGACTGTGSCQVTMNAAKSVTASFGLSASAPSVATAGEGPGTVQSSSARIGSRSDRVEPGSPAPQPGSFHTVTPCRAFDTRRPVGTEDGPALDAGETRFVPLFGICGIPASARAVSVNLTVTQPTSAGELQLYPADVDRPDASAISYAAGTTRGSGSIAGLSASGEIAIHCAQPSGTAHVIIDVNGYFE